MSKTYQLLSRLGKPTPLLHHEVEGLISCLLNPEKYSVELVSSILGALYIRGVSSEELALMAESLLSRSVIFQPKLSSPILDIVGTGGDGGKSFNISTAAAIVASGAGALVIKHGNNAASSQSGSSDVLLALGVPAGAPIEKTIKAAEEVGLSFLHAPYFHPLLAPLAPIRRTLGVPTIFNLLAPVCNPARPSSVILGVYDRTLLNMMADVLSILGVSRAMVVHSEDGLDEFSISSRTEVASLSKGRVEKLFFSPEDLGFSRHSLKDVVGGDAKENAKIIVNVLQGKKGAPRDLVVFNASMGLYVAGLGSTLEESKNMAENSIDSGAALSKLEHLIDVLS